MTKLDLKGVNLDLNGPKMSDLGPKMSEIDSILVKKSEKECVESYFQTYFDRVEITFHLLP